MSWEAEVKELERRRHVADQRSNVEAPTFASKSEKLGDSFRRTQRHHRFQLGTVGGPLLLPPSANIVRVLHPSPNFDSKLTQTRGICRA